MRLGCVLRAISSHHVRPELAQRIEREERRLVSLFEHTVQERSQILLTFSARHTPSPSLRSASVPDAAAKPWPPCAPRGQRCPVPPGANAIRPLPGARYPPPAPARVALVYH